MLKLGPDYTKLQKIFISEFLHFILSFSVFSVPHLNPALETISPLRYIRQNPQVFTYNCWGLAKFFLVSKSESLHSWSTRTCVCSEMKACILYLESILLSAIFSTWHDMICLDEKCIACFHVIVFLRLLLNSYCSNVHVKNFFFKIWNNCSNMVFFHLRVQNFKM